MAKANVKSGAITNRDAIPGVRNQAILEGGVLKEYVGTVEVADGDNTASTYRFCQIPSNCRVSQILLFCDDVGTNTTMDFGLYRTTLDGGAVVSQALFASAVALGSGAVNATDITHEAAVDGTSAPDGVEKYLWQELALSVDPGLMYDVVGTLTANADGSPGRTVAIKVRIVV